MLYPAAHHHSMQPILGSTSPWIFIHITSNRLAKLIEKPSGFISGNLLTAD